MRASVPLDTQKCPLFVLSVLTNFRENILIELFVWTNETVCFIRVSVIKWVSVSSIVSLVSLHVNVHYARKPLYKITRPNNLNLEIKLVQEETVTIQSIDKGRAQKRPPKMRSRVYERGVAVNENRTTRVTFW